MPVFSFILRDVLSDASNCCFLCFNTISEIEISFNIEDEVSLGIDIETTKVLYEIINTVLGDKVLDSISAHNMICQKCTGEVINCYKFIQQCRQNIEQLHCTIDSLQKRAQNMSSGNDYKSLFFALDTSNYNVELYYDKYQTINDQTVLFKRFQRLYNDSQQFYIDTMSNDDVESNNSSENKNCAVKRRKRSSIYQSIELADIVHDKDDQNNLKCKTCLKLYPTVTKMKQHYIRMHAPKDFKCSQCPKSFGSSFILKQHSKHGHRKAVCSQCGKTYTNIYSLRQHEIRHSKFRFVCHSCGKVYKGKRSFNNHIEQKLCGKLRKSTAEAKLSCDYCGKKYAQKAALSVHIRIEHENGKAVVCDWCGKKYSCMSQLKEHISKHTKQKDFECEQCGGKFASKRTLLYHTRTHTGEKPYKCELCEMAFLSASRRSEHVKRRHSHTQSHVECDICHVKLKDNSSLNRHKRKYRHNYDETLLIKRFQRIYSDSQQFFIDINNMESNKSNNSPGNKNCAVKRKKQSSILQSIELADIVHDKDDRNNLKCKTCLKLYPTVTKMKQHYIRMHAPKDFKCSQCPKSFGSSFILKQHSKDSHSSAVCSQCGKTYTNMYSLRQHEIRHSKFRFVCHTCGKVYKGKTSFNNHIEQKLCKKMRKSNAEAKFSCDYCGKKYAQKGALSLHIRIEHENGKAVICDWCGKKYSCMSRLKEHILKHTKQKDFKCEQCGGKFVTRTSLLYHTRTHTGEKPYKCELCELAFLSASRRSEHVKRHHIHTQPHLECDICHSKLKNNSSLNRHRRKHFDVRSRLYCNPPASVV